MAAVPALAPQRRKKPATYGKSSRNGSSWNVTNFDTLEERGQARKAPASTTFAVKKSRVVSEEEKPHDPKAVKGPGRKQEDIWEVSSSDEDRPPSPIRITSPPKFLTRKKPNLEAESSETELAPWEQQREARHSEPKAQPGLDQKHSLVRPAKLRSPAEKSHVPTENSDPEETPRASKSKVFRKAEAPQPLASKSPPGSSAAARLHAKRSQSTMSATASADDKSQSSHASKNIELPSDDAKLQPRKRIRRGAPLRAEEDHDTAMTDAPHHAPSDQPLQESSSRGHQDIRIYDFSASDDELHTAPIAQGSAPPTRRMDPSRLKPMSKWKSREKRPVVSRAQDDSDTPEATSRSPSAPRSGHVSPPLLDDDNGEIATTAYSVNTAVPGLDQKETQGAFTPKQANLWKQLLPSDGTGPSPSLLPLEQLNLNSGRRPAQTPSAFPNLIPKPKTFAGRRRARLVDRLKASAPGSDNEASSESDAESDHSVTDGPKADKHEKDEPPTSQQSQSQSQSQSQLARHPEGGPKITYARDRSYLQEESFEEGLMFELAGDTPVKPVVPAFRRNNSKQASQKSAFDLDESDDDAGSGRMRTVHELRAGGGNQRFMDDIGGLLDDIADHNISARGRRRTALMEIAIKLQDRAYAEKFLRQGFDRPLVNECGSMPDDIADFITTAGLATLMSSDSTEQGVQSSLEDGGYLRFLMGLLSSTTDVRKMARDRRYNMSKSAQSSLIAFVDRLVEERALWGDIKPTYMTARLVALKSLEQVIRRLRRHGNRTELVAAADIAKIWLPSEDDTMQGVLSMEDTLVVSILESLSVSTHALAWPIDLVRRLGVLLATLRSVGDSARHTLFLTLRLCVNLTNDNVRHCRALSSPLTVVSLLQAIRTGFTELDTGESRDDQSALRLDILVLSMGVLMNLAEHDEDAGEYASTAAGAAEALGELVTVCQQGQQRALEAESEEESTFNVAYGYLAVTLAQLCRYTKAKGVIASRLQGHRLDVLVAAVEEFVEYHRDVDRLSSEGGEGMEIWSTFTEKLTGVLVRLKTEAGLAAA